MVPQLGAHLGYSGLVGSVPEGDIGLLIRSSRHGGKAGSLLPCSGIGNPTFTHHISSSESERAARFPPIRAFPIV